MKRSLLALLLTGAAWAQTPSPSPAARGAEATTQQGSFSVTSLADRSTWQLGETVHLTWRVEGPSGGNVTFPAGDKLEVKPLEVKDAAQVTLPARGDRRTWECRVKLTAYEVGELTLPELVVSAHAPGEAGSSELHTPPLRFQVTRVPGRSEDKPDQIRDAKAFAPQAIPPLLLAAGLALTLLGLLLARALWSWWKRPRKVVGPPPLAPYPRALADWQALAASGSHGRGEWEPFYDELTRIVRSYLGWRFGLPLLEWTSSEILKSLNLPPEQHRRLKELLEAGDGVKFARTPPRAEQGDQHLTWTRELIEAYPPAAAVGTSAAAAEEVAAR